MKQEFTELGAVMDSGVVTTWSGKKMNQKRKELKVAVVQHSGC